MNISKIILSTVLFAFITSLPIYSYAGETYKFTITCPDRRFVAEWATGDIDPGKEYLRFTTGTKFDGCQVSDFNTAIDSSLPVDKYSHEGAVIQGVPLVGPVLCKFFKC